MEFKEFVDAFEWTNSKFIDGAIRTERILGRIWASLGKLQTVTFVASKVRIDSSSNEPSKYLLTVGMSKQHPEDRTTNKDVALEVAMENALIKPIIRMEVNKDFDQIDFNRMIQTYYKSNIHDNLKFVKTKQEINELNEFQEYEFIPEFE